MERDVRQALNETALLAQRIYPSTLELGGLAALLRSAAVKAEVAGHRRRRRRLELRAGDRDDRLLVLARPARLGDDETQVTICVREADDTLSFELAADALGADFDRLRDRVEALGGSLTIESEPGGIRLSGSLPLRR